LTNDGQNFDRRTKLVSAAIRIDRKRDASSVSVAWRSRSVGCAGLAGV
jgi:hypothetical protein